MNNLVNNALWADGEVNLLGAWICILYLLYTAVLVELLSNYYNKVSCAYGENTQPKRGFSLLAGLVLLAAIAGCASEAAAQSSYPAFTDYAAPSPAPAAPGDAFAPTMGGTAAATAPAGAEWTRSAGPDESVLLTGSRLSSYTDNNRGKDTRFMVYDGTAGLKQASVQRVDTGRAVLTLPINTAQWGMYLVWPGNEKGYGKPMALNKTDAWWVGPEKATRGAAVSVFGRNLAHGNDTLTSYVFIKPVGGAGQWATVTRVNPYKVDFTVPANLADGDYEIWTHNGHGQQYGWSGPLRLTIFGGVQWSGPTLNVRNYGAVGNGQTDDTQAINRALAAAKLQPGATVYFPAGVYNITDVLEITSNTRWRGTGANAIIQCAPGFSTSADALVRGWGTTMEIRDLTLAGNHSYRGTHPEPVYLRGSKEVWFTNVQFSFQGSNVLQLDDCYGVHISNCNFIGKTSYLGMASQVFIDRCQFRLTNDAEMALDSWGGSFISLTNSTCQNYDASNPADSTGWGKGRFYAGRGNFGSARCTYVGNNRTINFAVRPVGADQNSGEQFMWEGYFTDWGGAVVASTATTTTLVGFSTPYVRSHYAVITKGTGMGQSRRVTTYNGNVITLESAWNVPPDNTSVLLLTNVNDRAVVYGNNLDGQTYAVTAVAHNASAGIEPFGATTNFIVANNTLHELRMGLANWSTQDKTEPDPNFFSLYTNNRILNCRWGILNGLATDDSRNASIFGTTYRRNQISGALQSAIVNTLLVTKHRQAMQAFVYEHNTLQAALKGYSTGGDIGLSFGLMVDGQGIADQCMYKNVFSSTLAGAATGIKATTAMLVRENGFTGFAQPYAATPLQGELEAPYHVLELSGHVGATAPITSTLTLWNSGMSALAWTATSDASWLTLPVASGSILNEQASSSLALQAATAGLAPGSYQATITVTAAGRIKKYTVLLTITAAVTPSTLSVSITSPTTGDRVPGAAAIDIKADVQLPTGAGSISKVEFYVDGFKVGEATNYPYQCQWQDPLAGPHTLTAQISTTTGGEATSAPADITVSRRVASSKAIPQRAKWLSLLPSY